MGKKRARAEITAICKTIEEEFVMTVLIIYLQAAYRELKKEGKIRCFNYIIDRARRNYRKRQYNIEPVKRPQIWWR